MEFIVIRTSDWSSTVSCCPEAKHIQFEDNNYSIVEINSINDLIQFIDKYGSVIIGKKYEKAKPKHKYRIEIYDDWRE